VQAVFLKNARSSPLRDGRLADAPRGLEPRGPWDAVDLAKGGAGALPWCDDALVTRALAGLIENLGADSSGCETFSGKRSGIIESMRKRARISEWSSALTQISAAMSRFVRRHQKSVCELFRGTRERTPRVTFGSAMKQLSLSKILLLMPSAPSSMKSLFEWQARVPSASSSIGQLTRMTRPRRSFGILPGGTSERCGREGGKRRSMHITVLAETAEKVKEFGDEIDVKDQEVEVARQFGDCGRRCFSDQFILLRLDEESLFEMVCHRKSHTV
jgi:hypothetical protein